MEYTIIELGAKRIAGVKTRTNNSDPLMGQKIGGLWGGFFQNGTYASIPGKKDGHTYGLYFNYESDYTGDYDVMAGCEVGPEVNLPQTVCTAEIPAGRYTKFTVTGGQAGIARFWSELWQSNLERSYLCDFEVYPEGESDPMTAVIEIYIGLK